MTNKEISRTLRLIASLGELYGENEFKLKSLVNGAFQIDRVSFPIQGKTLEEIMAIPGIGKGIAQKILELIETGNLAELDELLKKTPPGIIELLSVKGIGPKKLATLWNQLGIQSPGELLYACNENRLVELNGFGEKTQKQIKEALQYKISSRGKLHYYQALLIAREIIGKFRAFDQEIQIEMVGQLRRKTEVVDEIALLCKEDIKEIIRLTSSIPGFENIQEDGNQLFFSFGHSCKVRLIASSERKWESDLFFYTGPEGHLNETRFDHASDVKSEADFYKSRKLPFIIPEHRDFSIREASGIEIKNLVKTEDIKGCIHIHSTWSDGAHSIEEMALKCVEMGYEYMVVTDHSKSAGYAGGLDTDKIIAQHKEIDSLNKSLAPFKIFKGIESDILSDGSLDYPESVLESFDMIIASVHSGLRMDENKATSRILKAIENPFTSILGHPTGRLLLSREGYSVDFDKIIEACKKHNVVIELNANPFRLDIDWRYILRCVHEGVMVSVNSDAHHRDTISDMNHGIEIARKGGLPGNMLFNGKNLKEMEAWIFKRKKQFSGKTG